MGRQRVDIFAIVALAFLLFMGTRILGDRLGSKGSGIALAAGDVPAAKTQATNGGMHAPSPFEDLGNQKRIVAPYDHYELTQGLHGYAYGHMAIDISAGKGAEIKSPINGLVAALFVDDLGNTTLVIENRNYRITMLHGIYSVAIGDRLELGQAIGVESNKGNTYDALGRSCRGRDCGYHTHLNIFDKRQGSNVDPLALIEN